MDKPKLHSPDLTQANIERLAELFPGCVTEARDDKGGLKKAIDFDQLRQELSDHIVEGPQERYRLNWPGKREALLAANAPIAKTLRPCREESVDFDNTENLFIEGDNLDALKLLQETYLNKVKMIYIDPPYNTGNDFIYDDDYAEKSNEYFLRSLQKDSDGVGMVANSETNGRYHSRWLSMMYSRLRLAKNLLRDDGILFVSIDEHEVASLKSICQEIFGENGFVVDFIWKKKSGGGNDSGQIVIDHEYILAYSRSDKLRLFNDPLAEVTTNYNRVDEAGRRYALDRLDKQSIRYTESLDYPITGPDGEKYTPKHKNSDRPNATWRWSRKKVEGDYDALVFENGFIYTKNHETIGAKPRSLLVSDRFGRSRTGKTDLYKSFDAQVMDHPKPVRLMSYFLDIACESGDIVMDFFAGSCPLGQAVIEHKNNVRGIFVQLPEKCDDSTQSGRNALSLGLETISDIGKERMRRVGKLESCCDGSDSDTSDVGFRVLKTDTSNMRDVYYKPDAIIQDDLYGQVDNIKPDRSAEDLLFQVMLDWGLDLALPIQAEAIGGKTVYFVDGDDLAACFEAGIDEEFVKQLAQRKPLRAVFRDTGYGSDNTKINVAQIFRLISPNTDVKSI
jgi:adenine-specific DNA-methyltransferase